MDVFKKSWNISSEIDLITENMKKITEQNKSLYSVIISLIFH